MFSLSLYLGPGKNVVSDADAKPVLSHIRSCSTHAFHAAVPKGQFGAGCHDGCTAFAHLLVRGFCDFALSHSLCLVVFFLMLRLPLPLF